MTELVTESVVIGSTTASWNVTTSGPQLMVPPYAGYLALLVTSVLFATNLVPMKRYEVGDSIFFQFIQCVAIGVYGVFFNWFVHMPHFEPFAMLGGAMWATGNLCCLIVVRLIGLGIGLVLWALPGLVLGWASGRFGWFGDESIPTIAWLQYLGVALAIVRGLLSMMIKPSTGENARPDDGQSLLVNDQDQEGISQQGFVGASGSPNDIVVNVVTQREVVYEDCITHMSPFAKRVLGVCLALFAGTLFGFQFAPIQYLNDKVHNTTQQWDYSFAFYSGVFAASTIYTMIYSMFKCNQPFINPRSMFPAFVSGLMWVVAQTGWFIANETLSEAVTFPIISTVPALIGLSLSVFLYGEIKGRTNMVLLVLSILVGLASVLMVAFST